ncbi:MAG TPA: fibronectin type III domain-containing protein, partial [Candidatus Limnocylindrales bacterium]
MRARDRAAQTHDHRFREGTMSGRERASRWRVGLSSVGLAVVGLWTASPGVAPVAAATPPSYYAIALGMVYDVGGATAINDSGVVAGQFGVTNQGNKGFARAIGTTIETVPVAGANPSAINAAGSIVGHAGSDPLRAIRVDGTTVTPIPGLAGTAGDVAYDIDDAGTSVIGASFLASGETRAWINDGTDTTELESFGGDYDFANRTNNAGLIAGSARDAGGQMHLVVWENGSIVDIGGAAFASANVSDMNEAGQVIASVTIAPNTNRAVLWDGTTAIDLGTLPGGDWTSAGAMNESGDVVVSAHDSSGKFRAARWDGESLIDLGVLPGGAESFATDINDAGLITGVSFVSATKTHGFLIADGVMYDVNDLLPADSVEVTNAQAISASGHILAYGINGQPILLVPGARPAADYDVLDMAESLTGQHFDASPGDMNADRQVAGTIDSRAFRYDGTTSSFVFSTFNESFAPAINSDGVVAGTGTNGGHQEAFRYDGSVEFLGTLGGQTSFAQDINGSGEVVGSAETSSGGRHAFVYRGGSMVDLHTLGGTSSIATDINDAGTVIGNYSPTQNTFRGFVATGSAATDLGTLGGGFTAPNAINESGVIVGTTATAGQANHAFRYANGSMTSVAPPGSISSEGIAINERGAIAGSYQESDGDRRAFLLDEQGHTLIPSFGGFFATSTDINESAQVVGYSLTESGSVRGYLFDGGELIDLSQHLPLGYESLVGVAFRINDDGTILARGVTSDFRESVLILIPKDAPPPSPPGPPTGVTALRGNAQATVSWMAPADHGGRPITGYTVTASPGSTTTPAGAAARSVVVTGLTNGTTYTFTVTATNDVGTSVPSAPSNAVTPGAPIAQSITFPRPPNATLAQSPLAVTATASSGLPVTLTSNTPAICNPSGLSINLLAAGTCTITASQAGNADYQPAQPVPRSFTVTKAPQSITFVKPANATMAQSPLTVAATASSGLPVTVTSSTASVCTISSFTVTLVGPGTCTLTATQPGDSVYAAATPVVRSFTVTKVAQTITFPKPPNATLLQSPLTLSPTASSQLPVALTSSTQSVCTVNGFQVTLLVAGTCTLTAAQPGDSVYLAATSITRSFNVTKAPQTITIPNPGPQSLLVRTVVLTPYASSGLPVTLASTSTSVCTVNGDVVTLVKAGTCRIRGTQAGNATYAAAPAVTLSIAVTATAAMPFVVASADTLTLGGQPFRLHGASIYGTSNPGAPNTPAQTVALASQAGLNTLRIVNPFLEDGVSANAPFAAADWQRVDQILARARGAAIRVVLDLSGFRNHLVRRDILANDVADTCAEEHPQGVDYAAIDPYRPALQAEWEAFLDFVVGRINSVNNVRYRDDATIAVISIAGEPLPPASDDCGKATSS